DLRKEIGKRFALECIIGNSPQMEKVFDLIRRVATHDVTVLLHGASGTGKELIAQAIHYASSRSNGPFIAIDCATLPETLVESELFGYERGAFTGAEARKLGKFELVQGGSLFLDEIGNLTPDTQVKLLRALQERKIERLGGKRPINVDVRLIAATNVNLEKAMEKGLFREDLYHRLNVFPIYLPPLKEREGDVPLLAKYFLAEFNKELKKEVRKISEEAMGLLINYRWPGNVRELENTIKSAILLAEETILPQHLPQKIQAVRDEVNLSELKGSLKEVSRKATQRIEKELITRVLREVHWNKSKASQLLNVDYKTLYNKIKEYGIKR
ncbi:sigma-54 dependent transcriptional regulator, partial [bacterium]|nr:sigma-54 dependent transcriptional regulator [bacterium]